MASLGARRNELNGVVHNAQPGINFHLREMERDREGETERKARKEARMLPQHGNPGVREQQQQIYRNSNLWPDTRIPSKRTN